MQWSYIKILEDNYAWILWNEAKEAILIDAGEYTPIINFIKDNNLHLKYILITHAHADHTDGITEIRQVTGAKVVGNKLFKERLPKLDIELQGGETHSFLNQKVLVLATPGHCADHLTFFFEKDKLLFVGDFIFSLGCGKIFEGTPMDMIDSFKLIKKLPKETLVFPSHEYTKANLTFAKTLGYFDFGEQEAFILDNEVTLPTVLSFELNCNPFLRLDDVNFKQGLMHQKMVDEVTFFKYLRELKNNHTQLIGG